MADSIDIFVGTDTDLETFIKEVEQLLGTELTLVDNKPPYPISLYKIYNTLYRGSLLDGYITISENLVTSRPDTPFAKYQHEIGLTRDYPSREVTQDQWQQLLSDLGRSVFDKLKALNKYGLLMMYNMEFKLDEYEVAEDRATD